MARRYKRIKLRKKTKRGYGNYNKAAVNLVGLAVAAKIATKIID